MIRFAQEEFDIPNLDLKQTLLHLLPSFSIGNYIGAATFLSDIYVGKYRYVLVDSETRDEPILIRINVPETVDRGYVASETINKYDAVERANNTLADLYEHVVTSYFRKLNTQSIERVLRSSSFWRNINEDIFTRGLDRYNLTLDTADLEEDHIERVSVPLVGIRSDEVPMTMRRWEESISYGVYEHWKDHVESKTIRDHDDLDMVFSEFEDDDDCWIYEFVNSIVPIYNSDIIELATDGNLWFEEPEFDVEVGDTLINRIQYVLYDKARDYIYEVVAEIGSKVHRGEYNYLISGE